MKRILIISATCLFLLSCNEKVEGQEGKNERIVPGTVETYTYPRSKDYMSRKYEVSVNGEAQNVIPTGEPEICVFGCTDTVKVSISTIAEKIESVVVRPLNKHPEYSVDGNTITLYMAPYDRYDVEVNGNETNPLFIFANPVDTQKPKAGDANVLFYAAGQEYNAGTIDIKSGQTLYIEGGAIVKGIITSTGTREIKIAGGGILNGLGADQKKLRLTNCNGITIKDLTVLGTTDWTTYICCCNNIDVDGYKAIATFSAKSDNSGNENDTFDLLGCNHAMVRHCFSYCHDDTFCIKTQKWTVSGTTTDVTFEDCIAWNKECGNGFVIGYETNQDVSDVLFKDCYSIHSAGKAKTLRRGALSIHNAAGGTLSNIRFENFYIEDPKEFGIYLEIIHGNYNIGNDVEWTEGHLKDVTLKNVYISKTPKYGNYISGFSASNMIENLIIEDLYIGNKKITSASEGYFNTCRYANVTFK